MNIRLSTKHFLYLYISLFAGYCTAQIAGICFPAVYAASTVFYFGIMLLADRRFKPVTIEKRVHRGGRELGGDIARTIAVILVPVLHFFGETYYYYTEFDASLILPTAIRWFSICAVPLFMIISGYFKSGTVISRKHYSAVFPLLATHIFITAIRLFVDFYFHNKPVDMPYIADKLLYFEYGWYIRLYIGMLLLMPFFNLAYRSLESRTKKEILLLTLIALTSLGVLTADIVPSSWLILYVFAYYIMGCYLSEYRVRIKPCIVLAGIAVMTAFASVSTYFRCKGAFFDWSFIAYHNNSGYSSPFAFIVSGLIMILCLDISSENAYIKRIFKAVSLISLEIYLFSQMFDGFIYKDITAKNIPFAESFPKIILLAGLSLVLSFIAGWAKKGLFAVILKGANKIIRRSDKNEQQ